MDTPSHESSEVLFADTQEIKQLEKKRGGYFYARIPAEFVNQLTDKRKTRFICTLEKNLSFRCGLNHLGDGNFFIILSKKNLEKAHKKLGDKLFLELTRDPNPLGVEIPEVLMVLLTQDHELQTAFDQLTMGKKRHIIHSIIKIKDIDKQINKAMLMIREYATP